MVRAMNYPSQPEILLTTIQLRIFQRLLAVMTADQVEQFIVAFEEIVSSGYGEVTVKIRNGHPSFIEWGYAKNLTRE